MEGVAAIDNQRLGLSPSTPPNSTTSMRYLVWAAFTGLALCSTATRAAPPGLTLPARLVANAGDHAIDVRFVGRHREQTVLVLADRVRFVSPVGESIELVLEPAPGRALPEPEAMASGATLTTLRGRDARHWTHEAPLFGRVRWPEAWPGIDVVLRPDARGWKIDYEVSAHADVGAIAYRFVHADGTPAVVVIDDGALEVAGRFFEGAPVALHDGETLAVTRRIERGVLGFALAARRFDHPLVIDPGLAWSGQLGQEGAEDVTALAIKGSHLFVAGSTSSLEVLGASNPLRDIHAASRSSDVFVARFALDTGALEKVVVFGGTRDHLPAFGCLGIDPLTNDCAEYGQLPQGSGGLDLAADLAVLGDGRVLVVGQTLAHDFPVAHAFQPHLNGTTAPNANSDGFVALLDADLTTLVAASYAGTTESDRLVAVTETHPSMLVVVGTTRAWQMPTHLDPAGVSDVAGPAVLADVQRGLMLGLLVGGPTPGLSVFGGSFLPEGLSDVSPDDVAFMPRTGGRRPIVRVLGTSVGGLLHPIAPGFSPHPTSADAFIIDVAIPSLTELDGIWWIERYASLGGSRPDSAAGLASDGWVALTTSSPDLLAGRCATNVRACGTTGTCLDAGGWEASDVALVRIDPANGACTHRIFFGAAHARATALSRNALGELVLVGTARGGLFPIASAFAKTTTGSSIGPGRPGEDGDGFVTIVRGDGEVTLSTYLGGTGRDLLLRAPDLPLAVVFDDTYGNAVVAGRTVSPDFPTATRMGGVATAPGWHGVPADAGDQGFVTAVRADVADLSVSLQAPRRVSSAPPFDVGVTVTNPGRITAYTATAILSVAPAARIVAPFPSGCRLAFGAPHRVECELGDLPRGAQRSLTLRVDPAGLIPDFPPWDGVRLAISATITSLTEDPDPTNDVATAVILLDGSELSLSARSEPHRISYGGAFRVVLEVLNKGPSMFDTTLGSPLRVRLTHVATHRQLPPGCTVSAATPPHTIFDCQLDLAPNATTSLAFDLDAVAEAPDAPPSVQLAVAIDQERLKIAPCPTSCGAPVTTVDFPFGRPSVSLAPGVSSRSVVRKATFTIAQQVKNEALNDLEGASTASGFAVVCTKPPAYTLQPGACALNTVVPGWPIHCPLPDLADGQQHALDIALAAPDAATIDTIRCQVRPPSGVTNDGAVTTAAHEVIVGGFDLAVGGSDTPDPVIEGGRLRLLIDVLNHGPDDAPPQVLSCTTSAPVGELQVAAGTCAATSSTLVTCNLEALGAHVPVPEVLDLSFLAPDTPQLLTTTCQVTSSDERKPADNRVVLTTAVGGIDLSVKNARHREAELATYLERGIQFDLENTSDKATSTAQLVIGLGVPASDLVTGTSLAGATVDDGCALVPGAAGAQAEYRCTTMAIAARTTRTFTLTFATRHVGDLTQTISVVPGTAQDPNPNDNVAVLSGRVRPHDYRAGAQVLPAELVRGTAGKLRVDVHNAGVGAWPEPQIRLVLDTDRWQITGATAGACVGTTIAKNLHVCKLASLDPAAQAQVDFDVVPKSRMAGPITVVIESATGIGKDENPADDITSVAPTIKGSDLVVTAVRETDPVLFGQPVIIEFTVRNDAAGAATSAEHTFELKTDPKATIDALSGPSLCGPRLGQPHWSCELDGLAVGQARTYRATFSLDQDGRYEVAGTAARTNDPDDDPTPGDATALVAFETGKPDLVVTANALSPLIPYAPPGASITWRVEVANKPGVSRANNAVLAIPILGLPLSVTVTGAPCAGGTGPVECALGHLEPGQSKTLDLRFYPSSNDKAEVPVALRARHDTEDKTPGDDAVTVVNHWEGHQLAITTTPGSFVRGVAGPLGVSLENTGRVPIEDLKLTVETGLRQGRGELAEAADCTRVPALGSYTCERAVPLTPSATMSLGFELTPLVSGTIAWILGVQSSTPADDPSALVKSGTFTVQGPDLAANIPPMTHVDVNQTGNLSLRVSNHGPATARASVMSLTWTSEGLAFENLPAGCATTSKEVRCDIAALGLSPDPYYVDLALPARASRSGTHTVTMSVVERPDPAIGAADPDASPANNTASGVIEVRGPNLSIEAFDISNPPVGAGDFVDIDVKLCNLTNVAATGVVVSITGPADRLVAVSDRLGRCTVATSTSLTCAYPTFNASECIHFHPRFRATDAGPWTVTAQAAADDDSDLTNNQAGVGGTVRGADLHLALAIPTAPIGVGELVELAGLIQNHGPSEAKDPTLTLTYPSGQLGFVSASPACLPQPGRVVCRATTTLTPVDRAPHTSTQRFDVTLRAIAKGQPLVSAVASATPLDDGTQVHVVSGTLDILDVDGDLDGIPDAIEDLGGGGTGDANNDGVPDREQPNVVTVVAENGAPLTVVAPANTSFTAFQRIPPPEPRPPGIAFPLDVYAWTLAVAPGATHTLTYHFPLGVPTYAYWKHGRTPQSPTLAQWYDFAFDGTTGYQLVDPQTLTVTFKDGARGDDDLSADGVIRDPGGPTLPRLVVETTLDTAPGAPRACDVGDGCSLREAITTANADGVPQQITFALPAGRKRLVLAQALPTIAGDLVIDGLSQPGWGDDPDDGPRPIVELDGSGVPAPGPVLALAAVRAALVGLNVYGAAGDAVTVAPGARVFLGKNAIGLDILSEFPGPSLTNAARGVSVEDARALIIDNLFGGNQGHALVLAGDVAGSLVMGNRFGRARRAQQGLGLAGGGDAIALVDASDVLVRDNVIVAHEAGVSITGGGDGVVIAGNVVGIEPSGVCYAWSDDDLPLIPVNDHCASGNRIGVVVLGATGVRIGVDPNAPRERDRNVVSDNASHGIVLGDASAEAIVAGNWIGLGAEGVCPRHANTGRCDTGNGGNGIEVLGARHVIGDIDWPNVLGDNAEGARGGPFAGLNAIRVSGPQAQGNTIAGNWIGLDARGLDLLYDNGLAIVDGASGTLVEGNVVGVIGIDQADDHLVRDNLIGLLPDGLTAVGTIAYEGLSVAWSGGVTVLGAAGVEVSDNTIVGHEDGFGIVIADGASEFVIEGNRIGTLGGGPTLAKRNRGGVAIGLMSGSFAATIGGVVRDNVIAYSAGPGVRVFGPSQDVSIVDNVVGLLADGSAAGNAGAGIIVGNSFAATVFANVVGANTGHGIAIGVGASDARVVGNLVGETAGGLVRGNGGAGIWLEGALTEVDGNLVAHNGGAGIAASVSATPRLAGNRARDNGGLAWDRHGDDAIDAFAQDLPVVASASDGTVGTRVTGEAYGTGGDVRLDVFAIDDLVGPDPSGHGEGDRFLGSAIVQGSGRFDFDIEVPGVAAPGELVTVTATRLDDASAATSEHARNIPAGLVEWADAEVQAQWDPVAPGLGGDSRLGLYVFHRAGPTSFEDLAVTVALPTALTVVDDSGCVHDGDDQGTARWRCHIGLLSPGGNWLDGYLDVTSAAVLDARAEVALDFAPGGPTDITPGNDATSARVVFGGVDLRVTTLVQSFAAIASPLLVDVNVENGSSAAASDVVLAWQVAAGWLPGMLPDGCHHDADTHAVTCDIGALEGLESRTLRVAPVPMQPGPATNRFEVAGAEPDPDPNTNVRELASDIGEGLVNVRAQIGPSALPLAGGVLRIAALDAGGKRVATTLTVELPLDLPIDQITSSAGSCAPRTGGGVTCDLGVLPFGGAIVDLALRPGASPSANVRACAAASGDIEPSDDCAEASIDFGRADLWLALDGPNTADADEVTLVATLLNLGPATATASVTIAPPVGATLTELSLGAGLTGSCAMGAAGGTCTVEGLASAALAFLYPVVTLPAASPGFVVSAVAAHAGFDPNASNDSATRAIGRPGQARANAALTGGSASALAGDRTSARFVATLEDGARAAIEVAFAIDPLGPTAALVGAESDCGSCALEGAAIVCALVLEGACDEAAIDVTVALDADADAGDVVTLEGRIAPGYQNALGDDDTAVVGVEVVAPAIACATGERARILFHDGFEGGEDGLAASWVRTPIWGCSAGVPICYWAVDDAVQHAGRASVRGAIEADTPLDLTLRTPLLLPADATRVAIVFSHRWDLDSDRTHGLAIQWSHDGAQWIHDPDTLSDTTYNGEIHPFMTFNPLWGKQAFVTRSPAWPSFSRTVADVGAGHASLLARFVIGVPAEANTALPGWWIDDVQVLACVPADPEPVSLALALDEVSLRLGDLVAADVTVTENESGALTGERLTLLLPAALEVVESPSACGAPLPDGDRRAVVCAPAWVTGAPEALSFTLRAVGQGAFEVVAAIADRAEAAALTIGPSPTGEASLSLGFALAPAGALAVDRVHTLTWTIDNAGPSATLATFTSGGLPAHVEVASATLVTASGTTPIPIVAADDHGLDCAVAPAGVRCGLGLDAGASAAVTLALRALEPGLGGVLARVAGVVPDPDASDDQTFVALDAREAETALGVQLEASGALVLGTPARVIATVVNAGPDAAAVELRLGLVDLSPAIVDDSVAALDCRLGVGGAWCGPWTLASGASAVLALDVTAGTGGLRTISATVVGDAPDPDADDDRASLELDFGPTCAGVVCDDGDPCTEDRCVAGACESYGESGAACDDGDACTTGDVCVLGACLGRPKSCSHGKVCTADVCLDGVCTHPPADGGACSDGQSCTLGDYCEQGTCRPGVRIACDDGNPCTVETCGDDGTCRSQPAVGQPCDDGDLCTKGEQCGPSGACGGGSPVVCDDGNACTTDQCNPASGCTASPRSGPCDDGNACTLLDQCIGGGCVGSAALVCDDGDPCTLDFCDPVAGCVTSPRSDEECGTCAPAPARGACLGGTTKRAAAVDACGVEIESLASCDDRNPCTDDRCEVRGEAAVCLHEPKAGCDPCGAATVGTWALACDGDLLVWKDPCGRMVGLARSCLDGDPCTSETCDGAITACVSEVDPSRATWGCPGTPQAPCALEWRCDGKRLVARAPCTGQSTVVMDCDDGDASTIDTCDATKRRCVVVATDPGWPAWPADPGVAEPDGVEAGPEQVEVIEPGPELVEVVEVVEVVDTSDAVDAPDTSDAVDTTDPTDGAVLVDTADVSETSDATDVDDLTTPPDGTALEDAVQDLDDDAPTPDVDPEVTADAPEDAASDAPEDAASDTLGDVALEDVPADDATRDGSDGDPDASPGDAQAGDANEVDDADPDAPDAVIEPVAEPTRRGNEGCGCGGGGSDVPWVFAALGLAHAIRRRARRNGGPCSLTG